VNAPTLLLYLGALVVALHGLIHLLGFVAYWPLATIPSLPYRTALFGGRVDVGAPGVRLFAVLWLLAAVGFVGAGVGLVRGTDWWLGVMLAVALLSAVLTGLDWRRARVGLAVDAVILVVLTASRLLGA
jgi:hypothetical protein